MDYMPNIGDEVILVRRPNNGIEGPGWVPEMSDLFNVIGTVTGAEPEWHWVRISLPGASRDWLYDISWLEPVGFPCALAPGDSFDETSGDF